MRWAAAVLVATLTLACDGSGSRVLVDLRTDYGPGTEFTSVVTRLSVDARTFTFAADGDEPFETGVRVAEAGGIAAGSARVTVTLTDAAGTDVAHATTAVEVRGTTGVTVGIRRGCPELSCPDGCSGGRCSAPGDAGTVEPACGDGIASPGELCFEDPRHHLPGLAVASIAVGDADGDGDLDVVAPHTGGPSLLLLAGDGAGTLAPPLEIPLGVSPDDGPALSGITLADLNDDELLDVLIANTGTVALDAVRSVLVLIGTGGGRFAAPAVHPVADGPRQVAVGDFTADGLPDLITANFGPDGARTRTVSVLPGLGGGRFGSEQEIDLGADVRPSALALADLDGRPGIDVATADFGSVEADGSVSLVLNDGGTASVSRLMPPGSRGMYSIAAADLDGDPYVDLAALAVRDSRVQFFHGSGPPGAFLDAGPSLPGIRFPQALALADLDRDTDTDLLVANTDLAALVVARNDGNGFVEPVEAPCDGAPCVLDGAPVYIAVGDLDRDGLPDVVTANFFLDGAGRSGLSVILSDP